ncbi:hypothetical protein CHH77_15205 [Shouchella clausii]|nr:hypothetical protein CHH77_15205 [Shouchella clausii]
MIDLLFTSKRRKVHMEKAKDGNLKIDYVLAFLSAFILIYHLTTLVIAWSDIPNQIAIHYLNGIPDKYGPKYLLIVIPLIGVLIWFLLGILVRKPEKFNYINLTEANKDLQYMKARRIMSVIQNTSFIMLLFVNKAFIRGAMGLEYSFQLSISLLLLAICGLTPLYFLIWAFRLKY